MELFVSWAVSIEIDGYHAERNSSSHVVPSQAALLTALYAAGATTTDCCRVCQISDQAAAAFQLPPLPLTVASKDGSIVSGVVPVMESIVTSTASQDTQRVLMGTKPFEKALIDQWMSFAVQRSYKLSDATSLHTLNSFLESRTFVTGHHISLADLCLFPMAHAWVRTASQRERMANCNLLRWFDHMQHLPGIKGAVPSLGLVRLSPAPITRGSSAAGNTPSTAEPNSPQLKTGKGKKKGKDNKTTTTSPTAAAAAGGGGTTAGGTTAGGQQLPTEGKKKNKKKKGGGGDAGGASSSAPSDPRPQDDPTRAEIRVGYVTEVWTHPDADSLYCEKIDIGESEPRRIASGLRNFLSADAILNKKVCVLVNLSPKKLRGFSSHGMVLCASNADRSVVELIQAPQDAKVGELVFMKGLTTNDVPPQLPLTSFAAVSKCWRTDEDKQAFYNDSQWMTSAGPCYCHSVAGGTIS